MKRLNKAGWAESWVIYRGVMNGEVGSHGVCEQAEWETMEQAHPGGTIVVQLRISDRRVAERLARAADEPVSWVWRELTV